MESKKDIGKFFKENLDQLDVAPSAMVWDGIEKELRKKRRFLFWFFIAAFVGGSICTYTIQHLGLVPDFNTTDGKKSHPFEIDANSNRNNSTTDYNINNQKNSKEDNDSFTNTVTSKVESLTKTNSKNTKSSSITETNVTSWEKNSEIEKKSKLKNYTNKKTSITFSSKKTKKKKNSNSNELINNRINRSSLAENSSEIKDEDKANKDTKANSSAPEKETNSNSIDSLQKKNEIISEKEKSLKETKKDSATELPKEKSFDFIIAPYYGYTYPGKFGSGNSLSTRYNVLDEGGKPSQNFGVLVRWMGTEKIGIQTGIGMFQSHRFTEVEKNGTFFSNNNNLELDNSLETYSLALQNDQKVSIHEENSYIEVPVEVYYVISNKKLGIASTFGVSLFFLNENDVYLESEHLSKFRIGSSKNSTAQSFAANAKLNLFYALSKRIQLDVYPEFQFQIMSHKDVSSFYPYYFSLKAGISYKL